MTDGPRQHRARDEAPTDELFLPVDDLRREPLRDSPRTPDPRSHPARAHRSPDDNVPPPVDADVRANSGVRANPQEVGLTRADRRRESAAAGRKRRGRIVAAAAIVVLLVLIAGGVYGGSKLFGGGDPPADYAGPGGGPVVIEVRSGDTASEIATEMVAKDVTASEGAFYDAAVQNSAMNAVQPGFYRLKSQMAAVDAVTTLVDPASRVGQVVIAEGRQLHDSADVNTGAVKKGIYTLISESSCAVGQGIACVSYDDLNTAGAGDPAELGVPDWALNSVSKVPDRDRQLEGLIAAGTWNFDPSLSAVDILKQLVGESAEVFDDTGLVAAGQANGLDPYQVLIASSLIEREALPADFSKVARVILNRLDVGQRLEFDSTVNYALDTTEVATTDADRARVTPWNTYAMEGLPATPICAPSVQAVQAAENPEPGNWLYFVTINAAGDTLFTDNYDEHLANIQKVEPGFLDSGR